MNIKEVVLLELVISFMEHQIEHIKSHAAIDYLRERISFFAKRCDELKDRNHTSLSPSEIAELHIISTEYCYALQTQNKSHPAWTFYVATANQIRDRLGEMRNV